MVVKEIKNIIEYTPKKEFLQSWFYGEFLKKIGRKVIRLENSKGEQLQALISNFRFGKFAYIPRGEIKDFSEFLVYFKKQNFAFVRLENVLELKNQQKEKTFIIKNRQPKNTWLLNIEKEEDEILTEMHSKTRYNINLAERKGVKIVEEKNLESFWKLNEITVERNSYNSHPKEYVAELLKLENVYQLNAYFENSILASAILLGHDDTLIYFFGASGNEHRNLMAPYLLHWEIIKLAKKLGFKKYDFWGIAPAAKEGEGKTSCHHNYCWQVEDPLNGVTRFKAGFGGYVKSYPEALEIILNSFKYKIYKLLYKTDNIIGHPKK